MYEKDKVSGKYYLYLEDKNVLCEIKDPKKFIRFYTLLVEQNIDGLSALSSIEAPFKLMHSYS